jgi:hypothetical protein
MCFAKFQKGTTYSFHHFCPWNWTEIHEILYCGWRGNLSRKFDFVKTNQTKITGTLHEDLPLFAQENAVDLQSLGMVP